MNARIVATSVTRLPEASRTTPRMRGTWEATMPEPNAMMAETTHLAMGTVMAHKACGPHAQESLNAVQRELVRLEALLSRFRPDSDISRMNGAAGIGAALVSRDTLDVLSLAASLSQTLAGRFDVTVGPLVALWHQGREACAAPDARQIRDALGLVGSQDLWLEPRKSLAFLRKAGQSVDLGGIGKGYAGDRLMQLYRHLGVTSAFSNLGGNVVTVGARPDGAPWRIGIQHPRDETALLGSVEACGESVVTSGDYQRYFTDRHGRRHHHILDPLTGYPAEAGLISVTIVSERSVVADALSTAWFVAGLEEGLAWLPSFERTEAILVDSELQVYLTAGLNDRFVAAEGIQVKILD